MTGSQSALRVRVRPILYISIIQVNIYMYFFDLSMLACFVMNGMHASSNESII